ncbi:MFS transporter [Microbacterium sp. BR1]|uniref:MFS transporter n=1 Tax=Microbacterium sp. BR1 TaxID=1070896 RepID=UPI000C2CD9F7|nr:MFS transporter [Microbacterium sp. BR1]
MTLAVAPASRVSIAAVGAVYAVQGLGFAMMVTSFPAMKDRYELSDTLVSILLLSLALTAAAGSMLANVISVRRNSRMAVLVGLALQALGLATVGSGLPLEAYVLGVVIYGVGLGAIDASSAMQGVLAQRGRERTLLGRYFAVNTLAAITATIVMSTVLGAEMDVTTALLSLAVVNIAVAVVGSRTLIPEHAARSTSQARAGRLPWRPVLILGALIFAAFTADSAVASWSSVYTDGTLDVPPATAPLAYGAYLVVVLLSRLSVDFFSRRVSTSTLALGALAIGVPGCALVAFIPTLPAALIGFALIGVVAGALVPVTFTAAGLVSAERSDELVARVNLFNYAGAIVGAVATGLIGESIGLGLAFLLPLVVLVAVVPAALALGRLTRRSAVGGSGSGV